MLYVASASAWRLQVRLTILGSSADIAVVHEPNPGYLVSHRDASLLLDCGPGIAVQLPRYIPLNQLCGVVISHMHMDNSYDLIPLARGIRGATTDRFTWESSDSTLLPSERVPMFLPPGGTEHLARIIAAVSNGMPNALSTVRWIERREYTPGEPFSVGPFTVQAIGPVAHGPGLCFGIRVAAAGVTVAYTGESGPCGALTDVARDADVLLCDALGITSQIHTVHKNRHLSADEAARLAARSGVRQLVLTHVASDAQAWRDAMMETAREWYGGRVVIARAGMAFDISRSHIALSDV